MYAIISKKYKYIIVFVVCGIISAYLINAVIFLMPLQIDKNLSDDAKTFINMHTNVKKRNHRCKNDELNKILIEKLKTTKMFYGMLDKKIVDSLTGSGDVYTYSNNGYIYSYQYEMNEGRRASKYDNKESCDNLVFKVCSDKYTNNIIHSMNYVIRCHSYDFPARGSYAEYNSRNESHPSIFIAYYINDNGEIGGAFDRINKYGIILDDNYNIIYSFCVSNN